MNRGQYAFVIIRDFVGVVLFMVVKQQGGQQMIGVRYKNGLGKVVVEQFATQQQAKRFCFYELANTGYELFYINKYNQRGIK